MLSLVLIAVLTLQVWVWSADSDGERVGLGAAPEGSAAGTGSADQDWWGIVTALDAARGNALSAADPALLDRVYVADSAAAAGDSATIRSLAERGWRVTGGSHRISGVTVVADGSAVRVAVRGSLPSYPVLDGEGRQVGATAARPDEERILSLVSTAEGFRISAVEGG